MGAAQGPAGKRIVLVGLTLGILGAGAWLRVRLNDVEQYSPADERVYATYTKVLWENGFAAYPELAATHAGTPQLWVYPPPVRWAYYALSTATCSVLARCDERALATLSTLAGIALLALTFGFAQWLFGTPTALAAAALGLAAPLQLALGRRALQDAVVAAVQLAALWGIAAVATPRRPAGTATLPSWRTVAAAALLLTLALAVKETNLLLYPVAAAWILVMRRPVPRDLVLVAVPPILFAAIAWWCVGDGEVLVQLGRVLSVAAEQPYSLQYQSGPVHRPLADLVVLAPIATCLALAAVGVAVGASAGGGENRPALALAVALVLFVLVAGLVPAKNARWLVLADALARMLGAWLLVVAWRLPAWAVTAIVVVAMGLDWRLFQAVFVGGKVYDPVTAELVRALGMGPAPAVRQAP